MNRFKDDVKFKHTRERFDKALYGRFNEDATEIAVEDSDERFHEIMNNLHKDCGNEGCKHSVSRDVEEIYKHATSTEELILWCYTVGGLRGSAQHMEEIMSSRIATAIKIPVGGNMTREQQVGLVERIKNLFKGKGRNDAKIF